MGILALAVLRGKGIPWLCTLPAIFHLGDSNLAETTPQFPTSLGKQELCVAQKGNKVCGVMLCIWSVSCHGQESR